MYNFQPQALTDHELVKYCGLWLDDESLPIEAQREILKRLGARLDELEHTTQIIRTLRDQIEKSAQG